MGSLDGRAEVTKRRESRPNVTARRMQDLQAAIERLEPRNPRLCVDIAAPIARTAFKMKDVLLCTCALVEKARKDAPHDSEISAELGYQLAALGRYQEVPPPPSPPKPPRRHLRRTATRSGWTSQTTRRCTGSCSASSASARSTTSRSSSTSSRRLRRRTAAPSFPS
jgi:hypothetical protein